MAEKKNISHFLAIKIVCKILVSSLSCMADLEKLQCGHVSEYRQTTEDLWKETRQIKRSEEEKHKDAATPPSTDPAKQFLSASQMQPRPLVASVVHPDTWSEAFMAYSGETDSVPRCRGREAGAAAA